MILKILRCAICFIIGYMQVPIDAKQGNWQKDLSSVRIGVSYDGFTRAVVDCGSESIAFVIAMEEEFQGVIYTRGKFHAKGTSCFQDAKSGKEFALKIPFNDCGVKQDAAFASVTVVVQFDDDLIFPGDLAFDLKCSTGATAEDTVRSQITLVDADPAANTPTDEAEVVMESSTDEVATLYPPKLHQEL